MPGTIICAHRGLDEAAPENTSAAFTAALELGMAIEFDLRMTADGQPVILHDPTVDRTTDGSGPRSELSLAEARARDAGSWFGPQFAGQRLPSQDEVLDLVAGRREVSPAIALDLKEISAAMVDAVCSRLQACGLGEQVVGIGALIGSTEARRRFSAAASWFQSAAVAQKREELNTALVDPCSSWAYARFVPTAEDVQKVRSAGKRLLVCGNEVSIHPHQTHDAYRSGPDMVLPSYPTRPAALVAASGDTPAS